MVFNKYRRLEDNSEEVVAVGQGDNVTALIARLKTSQRSQHRLLIFQWLLLLIMGMACLGLFLRGSLIVITECDPGHVFCTLICSIA